MPLYRETLGRRLSYLEADQNIRELADAIVALQNDRPEPNNIESFTFDGPAMTIHMSAGPDIGPITLNFPSWKWRGAWTPFTLFNVLDTFVVDGVGIFSVLDPHTSGAAFDPAIEVTVGEPALQKIWGFAPDGGSSIIYDLEFQYQGVLSDALAPPVSFLALRVFSLPASADGQHLAYLVEAPSTAQQVLPILHDATQIGTVTFEIGENDGAVEVAVAETFAFADRLVIGIPAAADATAAGLTVALAAQRSVI
jgi:hypothetical protein